MNEQLSKQLDEQPYTSFYDRYLSTQLLTPRSDIAEKRGVKRELLLESEKLCDIKNVYEKSDKTFDDIAEAAKSVAELVRETLNFRSTGNFSSPLEAVNIAKDEAANCTLYTDLLLQKLPSSVNRSDFVARREWLMFSDGMKYRDGYGRNARLQMLTLPSIPGRLLLLDEYNARIDQLNGRYKEAADKIVDLSGIYLDVDSRNDLKEADKLCRELIKQGSGDLAIQVASVVNDSLLSGDSSKNRLFLPDVVRKVAKHDRDINLLNEAIRLYKEIINSKPKYDSLAVGKLRVAEKLLRSMKAAGAIVCDATCDRISE